MYMKDKIKLILKSKLVLFENLQQADKKFFKSGILTPQDRSFILSITNGDVWTKLVADWFYHLKTYIFKEGRDEKNLAQWTRDLYTWLVNYNKNLLPVKGGLNSYSGDNNSPKNILDLFSFLRERSRFIVEFEKLPSVAKRNIRHITNREYPYHYAVEEDWKRLRNINKLLEQLPRGERGENIMKKVFNSNDAATLEIIYDNLSRYLMSYNENSGDIEKDDLLEKIQDYDADIIQDSNNVLVVKANDQDAIRMLGCTSDWCFSLKGGEYWDDYATMGFVYVIFDFNKEMHDAHFLLTLLPQSNELYTSRNAPIEFYDNNADTESYLSSIGVDTDKLNMITDKEHIKRQRSYSAGYDDTDVKQSKQTVKDPNQLKLDLAHYLRKRLRLLNS